MALLAASLQGKAPSLLNLFPAGGSIGEELDVEFVGEFTEWPPQVWLSSNDIEVSFSNKKGRAHVKINPNATAGPILVRCFNADGASQPCFFLLSKTPEQSEIEPNDTVQAANDVAATPAIINGRLSKRGDTDSFQFELKKDQWLVAELQAYRLRSSLDPLLQVIDPNGIKVAFNHDHFHLDPRLSFQAMQSGKHIVQVLGFDYPAKSDIRLGGGKNFVYRLAIFTGPYISHTFPLGIQSSTSADVSLIGWNLEESRITIAAPNSAELANLQQTTSLHEISGTQQTIAIQSTKYPQLSEPTRDQETRPMLPLPAAVSGTINEEAQVDEYEIAIEKDKSYTFSVRTEAPIHQFDAWLELKAITGKLLKRNDDSKSDRDPSITWKANEDGSHILAIGNLLNNGSPNYYYHLSAMPALPHYKAQLEVDQLILKPGSTNEVAIKLTRQHGHNEPLEFRFRNLPISIQQLGGEVKASESKVSMQLLVSHDAPSYIGNVQMFGTETKSQRRSIVPVTFLGTSVNNGVPGGFKDLVINESDSIWLTIPPTKKTPAKDGEDPKP